MPQADAQRLGDFFRREYGRMVRYVRGLVRDAADRDGEDIVQDVMVRLFEAADVARSVEDLAAYVYRALRNAVIDAWRRKRQPLRLDSPAGEEGDVSLADVLHDARYDAAEEHRKVEIRRRLFDAIDRLPDDQRAVLIMTEMEGAAYRDISEKTGVPVGTLLSRKSRAMERIRKEIAPYRDLMEE
jgi:RNA polymerase sigma-70 factor (ECF subfamily)